jgi:hypothetical protein
MIRILSLLALLSISTNALAAPRCKPVVVFRNGLPTCTIQVLSDVTATGTDRTSLYQDIQLKVCTSNGQAIVNTTFVKKDGMLLAKGTAVRCNVPFPLPSDMRVR